MDNRNIFHRNLDTQITTGDHDTVDNFQDFIDVIDAFLVFNLGNDAHIGAEALQKAPDLHGIIGAAYKGGCNIIHSRICRKGNIGHVCFRHKGQLQDSPWHSDTLTGRNLPAVGDRCMDFSIRR